MTGQRIGYVRVSTREQNPDLQHRALAEVRCDRVFEDIASGSTSSRPGLGAALDFLRNGDTLIVWKLDRLGRTVKQLVDFVQDLHDKGIAFISVTDAIDTTTPAGRFFFHVMASLAQMERELMIERTKAGLEAARAQGRVSGRKPLMTDTKLTSAQKLSAQGTAYKDIAATLGISLPTLYRWMPAGSSQ